MADDSEVFSLDVDPDEVTHAEEAVLGEEEEFNACRQKCREMEAKFESNGVSAEELLMTYFDFLMRGVFVGQDVNGPFSRYSQEIGRARRLMKLIDFPTLKTKLLDAFMSRNGDKHTQLRFRALVERVSALLSGD